MISYAIRSHICEHSNAPAEYAIKEEEEHWPLTFVDPKSQPRLQGTLQSKSYDPSFNLLWFIVAERQALAERRRSLAL